jgi:hypothetical protein
MVSLSFLLKQQKKKKNKNALRIVGLILNQKPRPRLLTAPRGLRPARF